MKNVIVSGFTAAGKTTHSLLLAEKFGLRYVSASSIALRRAGLDPASIPFDFWITDEGVRILHDFAPDIDDVLLELESDGVASIFDCFYLPWLHRRPALRIWLESDVPSRLMKAEVSHRGTSAITGAELAARIARKDEDATAKLFEMTGRDMRTDRAPFDAVVELTHLIDAPTTEASARSVAAGDALLVPIVEAYLRSFRE